MKKSTRSILLLILVLAIAVTTMTVFTFIANAESDYEAVLITETFSYLDTGYEGEPKEVSREGGTYAELLKKLDNLDPTVSTRYILSLNKDVNHTETVTISAGALAEVFINLNGHTITSTASEAAFISTAEYEFRINGGYNALGERGAFVLTNENGSLVTAAPGAGLVDVKNLDITYSGTNLATAEDGTVTIRESSVTSTSSDAATVITAFAGAKANLKYVDITGGDKLLVLDLYGANGYIEGGDIFAGKILNLSETDGTAANALLASVDFEAVIAFNSTSENNTLYILGGNLFVSSELFDNSKLYTSAPLYYYGDGEMTVAGGDAPNGGSFAQTGCEFVLVGETYVLKYTGTLSSRVAMATTASVGEAPVVTYHSSYVKGMGADGIKRAITGSATEATVGICTLLQNAEIASNYSFAGNDNTSVIVDFNGYDLTWKETGSKSFAYVGDMHYSLDGADVDGKRGTMLSNSGSFMFLYPRQSSSTGINNRETVTRVTNINFVATNMGVAGSNAFINFNSGSAYLENVDLTYTGEMLSETATNTYVYLCGFDHSFGPEVVAHLKNVTAYDTSSSGLKVYPFNLSAEAVVYADNLTVNGCYAAMSTGADATATVMNSTLNVTGTVFTGGVSHIYDTKITVDSGVLATSGTVNIHETEKCLTVVDTKGNTLSGIYITNEGYAMVPTSSGQYQLTSGVSAPKPITFPAVFANGMVFQRGKTINVFGYCDDTEAELKVTLGDISGTTEVDENGKFYIELPAIAEAKWNLTLTVEQTNASIPNIVEFTDVCVGEVWVMSGQSNAQLQAGYMEDVEEFATLADAYGNIRLYKSSASFVANPSKYGSASWSKVDGKSVRSTSLMSAAGYAAVAKLADELGPDVPIALMHVARGASKIKAWVDYEALLTLSPTEAAKIKEYMDDSSLTLPTKGHTTLGTVCYNHQIAPLEGFEVAGVMWYQGCGDVSKTSLGVEGTTYTEYFTALEKVYRRVFGNDSELPFYVMELAPFVSSSYDSADLADFKAEQYDFCEALDNTYLVTNMLDGAVHGFTLFDQGYIHPGRKSTIGQRAAMMILANEYDFTFANEYTNPELISATVSGSTVTLTFDSDIKLLLGDKPIGFELLVNGTWVLPPMKSSS